MLAKNVEDRYQTCYGLRADLNRCWQQWRQRGTIDPFPLGQNDIRSSIRLPRKLYGRDKESQTLKAAWERVRRGEFELLMLAGSAGTGKTTLGLSIKPFVQDDGYFIYGKFDQVKKDIPYSALAQAFTDLVRQFLAEGKESCDSWTVILKKALGKDSAVITDLIPELKYLIGEPEEVSQLHPAESRNRFELTFKKFIESVATPQHPLVLFLDDLQWADEASLQLLALLNMVNSEVCLLLLGAYRDNEVEGDLLLNCLNHINENGTTVKQFRIEPLDLEIFQQLVADSIYMSGEESLDLSQVLYQKTDGNPFFLLQILQMLQNEKLVFFNEARGSWTWDLNAIQRYPGTENIIQFMTGKLRKLSDNTRGVLSLAACIGSKFDLELLAALEQKDYDDTRKELHEAIIAGLIIDDRENPDQEEYGFIHDRIQQAAYALLSDEEKQELHYKIGRLLLSTSENMDLDNQIFKIADHLNLGRKLIVSEAERLKLARYNLWAGRKARASGAWNASLKYLRIGTSILPTDCWLKEYQLTFELYLERAQSEYLGINFETAAKYFDLVLGHAHTPLERADVYNLKVVLSGNQGKRKEAIAIGIRGLTELGVRLPLNPGPLAIMKEFLRLKLKIRNRNVEKLRDLPSLENITMIKAMELLNAVIPCASVIRPQLFILVLLRMAHISLKYGNSCFSATAYSGYAITAYTVLKDYPLAYNLQKVAVYLDEKYPDDGMSCSFNFGVGEFLSQWNEHASKGVAYLEKAHYYALRSGNIFTGGTALARIIQKKFILGYQLDKIDAAITDYIAFLQWAKIKSLLAFLPTCQQFIHNLKGQTKSPLSFSSEDYDEQQIAAYIREDGAGPMLLGYLLLKIQSLYFHHAYTEAMVLVHEAHQKKEMVKSLLIYAEITFYESMVISAAFPEFPGKKRKQYLRQLNKSLKQMQTWALHAPENFASRALLMQAEIYRLKGQNEEALNCYDRAIESACVNQCRPNEGIASERAARLFLQQGSNDRAGSYLHRAHQVFLDWGAAACADSLEKEFPQVFITEDTTMLAPNMELKRTDSQEEGQISNQVDLFTIIKSSQAIAGEVDLEQLLTKLMQFLMENAGAQRACLLLEEEGQLLVKAQSDENGINVINNTPLEEASGLSQNIVECVKRTGEYLVLGDASQEGVFVGDEYIRSNEVKSVFCLPVFNQGRLTGILYLENNLSPHTFSAERVEILRLVSSQIAVSLENARLFTRLKESRDQIASWNQILEQRVEERTQDWQQANQELRLSEERYKNIFENTGTAMLLIDENGFIVLANSKIKEMFGYDTTQIQGQKWTKLSLLSNIKELEKQYFKWRYKPDRSSFTLECQVQDIKGNAHDIFVTASLVPGKNNIIASLLDVTERKQVEKLMKRMAYHDSLTGLPNRMFFHDRLHQAISRASRGRDIMAVMLLDLDNFKEINDNFGHEAGDQVLCEVARRLEDAVRQSDTVSRLGGDEFTLIFNGLMKKEDPDGITRKIRECFEPPIKIGEMNISVNCSIGVSLYPVSATDPDELIQRADHAMYLDKARSATRRR
ncbi:MAG: diguanylate cyclase [Syntrophomonas sp.]